LLTQLVLEADQRRGADPAPHEELARAIGGRAEPDPERTGEPQALAGLELCQPPRARPDRLEEEVERPVLAYPREGEGARHEWPAVLPAPAVLCREHVELPGARVPRPARVVRRDKPVCAQIPVGGHPGRAPAERSEGSRLRGGCEPHARARPVRSSGVGRGASRWSSWSDLTSGGASRAARIAR